jgi:hypothetical protein
MTKPCFLQEPPAASMATATTLTVDEIQEGDRNIYRRVKNDLLPYLRYHRCLEEQMNYSSTSQCRKCLSNILVGCCTADKWQQTGN